MEITAIKPPVTTKATWEMTEVELARVFAEHFGYTRRGNWISRPDGVAVGCGWDHFAQRLRQRGWIRVGQGVNWRAAGEHPRLARATRNERGYWE